MELKQVISDGGKGMDEKYKRAIELLEVSHKYLSYIKNSEYGDALFHTQIWDEVECDGHCLIEDIGYCLEIDE